MFTRDQYELLDFGEGRRLERLGSLVLDRFSPNTIDLKRKNFPVWNQADAVFVVDAKNDSERGYWKSLTEAGRHIFGHLKQNGSENSKPWTITHDKIVFELKGTSFGHVGLFPEQAENWDTIATLCRTFSQQPSQQLKILNLFAYTGGSTLAAAVGGAEVTHVDSARNIVSWGRKNAELSGLSDAPIRWITEDATKFVRREKKRGSLYQGIILDPPSYGHGAKGEVWRLSKQLPGLIADCFAILDFRGFLLLTCHTPGFTLQKLTDLVVRQSRNQFPNNNARVVPKQLKIRSSTGAFLDSGESVLWENC